MRSAVASTLKTGLVLALSWWLPLLRNWISRRSDPGAFFDHLQPDRGMAGVLLTQQHDPYRLQGG